MKTIQVFDPALCCSTGVCGVDVDQALVSFSADVDWGLSGARTTEIDAFAHAHARRHAVVPLLREEALGADRLLRLIGASQSQPVMTP